MRLFTFDAGDGPRPGVQVAPDGSIVDAALALEATGRQGTPRTVRDLLASGPTVLDALATAAAEHADRLAADGGVHRLDAIRLLPPIPDPEKIVCGGLNYHDHAASSRW